MKKLLLVGLFSVMLIISLTGCGGGGSKDLAVQTILWQQDGSGFTQYYTNDLINCDMGKYCYDDELLTQAELNTVEVQLKKLSGYSNMGYGINFCLKDSANRFLLLITVNGRYFITKRINGIDTPVSAWSSSSYLNQGYNTLNTIKVERTSSTAPFNVYFNGTQITQFDGSELKGGSYGFYVGIGASSQESFPNTPVDVRFKSLTLTPTSSIIKSTNVINHWVDAVENNI